MSGKEVIIDEDSIEIIKTDNLFSKDLPPIYVAHDKLTNHASIGRGFSANQRMISCYAETLERLFRIKQRACARKKFRENENMLDPMQLILPLGTQTDDRVIEWKYFKNLTCKKKTLLPRPCQPHQYESYFLHTSSGIAIHQSEKASRDSAFNELIERHLFNLFWLFESNLFACPYRSQFDELFYRLGWQITFYHLYDDQSAILCCLRNRKDLRFDKEALVIGLAQGYNQLSFERALSECLQVLEAYLICNKLSRNINYYLNEGGRLYFDKKLYRALNRRPLHITRKILSFSKAYYFHRKINPFLYYCETCIPGLLPLQLTPLEALRIDPKLSSYLGEVLPHNPLC